tara:strand:- start:110 stop:865 length:756 start_codon:yes stop_codon:yes gene_type:complete
MHSVGSNCNYILDVGGTLIPKTKDQIIDPLFEKWFLEFECNHNVYLVTGSSRDICVNRIGIDVFMGAKRVYCQHGNVVYEGDIEVYRNPWRAPSEVYSFLESEIRKSKFPNKKGGHIIDKPGYIRFTLLGSDASDDEKCDYRVWDNQAGERDKIVRRFYKRFPHLHAEVNNKSSIGVHIYISLPNKDKSQVLNNIEGKVKYYGDKIYWGGNDYSTHQKIMERGIGNTYMVDDYKHTWELLKNETSVSKSKG